jgi:hypothetical protein
MSESDTIDYQRLRDRLDYLAVRFNCLDFIELDPISVPHCFSKKQDIEIAGFLALFWHGATEKRSSPKHAKL